MRGAKYAPKLPMALTKLATEPILRASARYQIQIGGDNFCQWR